MSCLCETERGTKLKGCTPGELNVLTVQIKASEAATEMTKG